MLRLLRSRALVTLLLCLACARREAPAAAAPTTKPARDANVLGFRAYLDGDLAREGHEYRSSGISA